MESAIFVARSTGSDLDNYYAPQGLTPNAEDNDDPIEEDLKTKTKETKLLKPDWMKRHLKKHAVKGEE